MPIRFSSLALALVVTARSPGGPSPRTRPPGRHPAAGDPAGLEPRRDRDRRRYPHRARRRLPDPQSGQELHHPGRGRRHGGARWPGPHADLHRRGPRRPRRPYDRLRRTHLPRRRLERAHPRWRPHRRERRGRGGELRLRGQCLRRRGPRRRRRPGERSKLRPFHQLAVRRQYGAGARRRHIRLRRFGDRRGLEHFRAQSGQSAGPRPARGRRRDLPPRHHPCASPARASRTTRRPGWAVRSTPSAPTGIPPRGRAPSSRSPIPFSSTTGPTRMATSQGRPAAAPSTWRTRRPCATSARATATTAAPSAARSRASAPSPNSPTWSSRAIGPSPRTAPREPAAPSTSARTTFPTARPTAARSTARAPG